MMSFIHTPLQTVRGRLHISLLVLSEFTRIKYFLNPLKSLENLIISGGIEVN